MKIGGSKIEKREIGQKIGEAADFLVEHLAGRETATVELTKLALENGICERTLKRAKKIVGAKPRKQKRKWYISVPEEMKGRIFSPPKKSKVQMADMPSKEGISRDWISVTAEESASGEGKIEIPARVAAVGRVRIKIGGAEFEADENFPAEQLAKILRDMEAAGK